MAQSRTYFGLRRGSTKTQTFSVLNGKQITKDRQEGGRNPQTPEQMTQRMVMATVSAAYAQMKRIVDHSFEGVTYGGQTMAEFIKVNAAALRQNIADGASKFAYNNYRDRALYPGQYIMSRGSAAPINVAAASDAAGIRAGVSGPVYLGPFMVMQVGGEGVTLTANNILNAIGCKAGDMATGCFLVPIRNVEGYSFTFIRIKCLKGGDVVITSQNYGDYFAFESDYPVEVVVTASFIAVYAAIPDFETEFPGGVCIIHSLKTASGWLRSNEALSLEDGIDVSPDAEQAFDTYPVGPSYVLNGGQV